MFGASCSAVSGPAIVRAHNRWARDWTVLITLSGWFGVVFGLVRMFAAGLYQAGFHRNECDGVNGVRKHRIFADANVLST